jgi:hypothetical protein
MLDRIGDGSVRNMVGTKGAEADGGHFGAGAKLALRNRCRDRRHLSREMSGWMNRALGPRLHFAVTKENHRHREGNVKFAKSMRRMVRA